MTKNKKEEVVDRNIDKEIKDRIVSSFSEKNSCRENTKSLSLKIFGELVGLAISLFMLFVVFPKLPFITEKYYLWRPIALWTTIAGSFLKILKHAANFNVLARLSEMIELSLALYSTYMLIRIFPLDFANIGYPAFNIYFPYLMYVAIFGMSMAIIVNFFRIFFPEKSNNR
jgi:hypothetical protein